MKAEERLSWWRAVADMFARRGVTKAEMEWKVLDILEEEGGGRLEVWRSLPPWLAEDILEDMRILHRSPEVEVYSLRQSPAKEKATMLAVMRWLLSEGLL